MSKELDEMLLDNGPLDKLERAVRDRTDMYLGHIVLNASTLLILLRRVDALYKVGNKIRPLLCTSKDTEAERLVEELDRALSTERT